MKHRSDGSLERYKARLVSRGTRRHGVDYQEIFALVVKMNSLRVFISLATSQGWSLLQFDVKNDFFTWGPRNCIFSSKKKCV